MRCFFAIPVPTDSAEKVLKLLPPLRGLRRVRAEGIHVTLRFLADAPADLPDRIELPPLPSAFRLEPTRHLLLPESGPVRVIAMGLGGATASLQQLHSAVTSALAAIDIAPDDRRFVPHITLARCVPPLPQQVRGQKPMELREDAGFLVSGLSLIESRQTDAGLQYHTLRRWDLQV
jgi:RNA 2',3'-cyclic 3'-phosphodiesterase